MSNIKDIRDRIFDKVVTERNRQDEIWGRQAGLWDDHDMVKLTVVTEEVGEIAKAVLENSNLYEEIIQTIAVLTAWSETIELELMKAEGYNDDEDTPMTKDEEAKHLEHKIKKLSTQLAKVRKDIRDECDHVFVYKRSWNHHDGWDQGDYLCGEDYQCEKCGVFLVHQFHGCSIGRGSTYQEFIFGKYSAEEKTLLKYDSKELEIFDPVLKTFRAKGMYSNGKIELLLTPGLRIEIRDLFGVYDTKETVRNVDRIK